MSSDRLIPAFCSSISIPSGFAVVTRRVGELRRRDGSGFRPRRTARISVAVGQTGVVLITPWKSLVVSGVEAAVAELPRGQLRPVSPGQADRNETCSSSIVAVSRNFVPPIETAL